MYYPKQEGDYYSPENYSQDQSDYAYTQGIDTSSMIEISEQVFSEKIKKIQKQVEGMNEFKTLAETKIEYISSRLKRIETVLDNLQSAILQKVGSYGGGLDNIRKEMSMMQDSFGKMVGGLAEKHHAHQIHHTHNTKKDVATHHRPTKKTSRKR